ncbi:MAG TPA: ThuA domain-containing protein [Longimicrobiaceae bacterium]
MNLPKVGLGLAVLGILAGFVWEEAANGGTSASRASTAEGQEEPIRVLVVTATHGFRHTEGIEASKAFLNGVNGADFQFDVTEDPADINAQNLQNYDVLFLNNATLRIAPANPDDPQSVAATRAGRRPVEKPITAEQQQAISEFVRSGKGLVCAHSGVDALYGWDEYREMVGGGLFREHPWTQEVQINVEDPSNPAVAHLAPSFRIHDEIYVLDGNPRETSHVLMSLDMPSTGSADTSADHPISWIRRHGEGRVFVTVLGHFGEVWQNPGYQQHILQGIRIAAGRLEADFQPR